MPLRPRSRLGPYEVVELLGAGGMGEVYRAHDPRLSRDVAIKILPEHAGCDASRRRRFEHEARAASVLNHPNICTIHDIDEHEGLPYIVMELLDGVTLKEYLRDGPVPLPVLLRLAEQVADALDVAHAAGIIHRDLTPANLFVTKRGDAKVLDFGLAKLTADFAAAGAGDASATSTAPPLTSAGRAMGTPGYASPEQTLGMVVDARTDLFSFGAVLYEMATGRRAFSGSNPALAWDAAVHAVPPPVCAVNPTVPAGLSDIVAKAIEKDPELRYRSAADIKTDLRRLARTVFGTPRPSGPHSDSGQRPFSPGTPVVPPPPRPTWRRPGVVALFGLVVAAAAVAYFTWTLRLLPGTVMQPATTTEVTAGAFADIEPAVSPDGNTIAYVVDDGERQSIWLAETRGGLPSEWTKTPGHHRHPAWAPDGRIYFESERDGQRGIFTAPAFDASKAEMVVENARQPALSRDGRRLAFVTSGPSGYGRVAVTAVENPSRLTSLTGNDDGRWDHSDPAWSPSGDLICYAAADGLWTVSASGAGRAVPLTRGVDTHPAWSASGFIYFSSLRDGTWRLFRVRPGGGEPERVTSGVTVERMPSLSGDDSVLAFSKAPDSADVVIRDLATGEERPFGGVGSKNFPVFAPDGHAVFLLLDAWNRKNLFVQPLANGEPAGQMFRLVADSDQSMIQSQPAVSGDGAWVAFLGIQGDSREVYVVPSRGGAARNISNHPSADYHPAWSPDGSTLSFVSERDGRAHVWLQPIDAGRPSGPPVRLTQGADPEICPSWSSDGTRVAFVTGASGSREAAAVGSTPAGTTSIQILTAGARARRVRWTPRGWLLVAGEWVPGRFAIRAFDPAARSYVRDFKEIDLGTDLQGVPFDVSADERYLALVRLSHSSTGKVVVMKSNAGGF